MADRDTYQDGEAVRWARQKDRRTQTSLADAIGTTQSHISEIENEQVSASPDTLYRIAEALNCPVSVLERKRAIA